MIDSCPYPKGFKGSRMFTFPNSRLELPYLNPPGYKIALWKILSKFVT